MFEFIEKFICFFSYEMTQTAMPNKIIYSLKEINQIKKLFKKIK